VERGRKVTVVTVVRSGAGQVRGKVRVKVDGRSVGTLRLHDGRAVLKVRARFARGTHKVVVTYLGDAGFARSKDSARLRVTG
jgi:hypothetical protein